jgi:agmatinase
MDSLRFLGTQGVVKDSGVLLVGVPFDGTASFKSGARFGPDSVRSWSDVLETYSPVFDRDLADLNVVDMGNLIFSAATWREVSDVIQKVLGKALSNVCKPVLIGGEHIITLSAVEECLKVYPDLTVVQMDAHLDLRDDYGGTGYSHATVMKRVLERVGEGGLIQFGARSGTREEWALARNLETIVQKPDSIPEMVREKPVYLTVDLDVLDPSVMPETGTPEPGGLSFADLHEAMLSLRGLNIIGGDVVEYCPSPDGGGPSGAVAAKVIREMIFLLASGTSSLGGECKVQSPKKS